MKVMRGSRRLVGIAAATATALALAGCGSEAPAGDSGKGADIKVGVLAALTGIAAPYGVQSLNSLKLAVNEVNAQGGIDGHKLVIDALDNQSKPEQVPTLMRRLVSDGASVIVGASSSPVTITAAQTADQLKVPLLVPMEAADAIIGDGRKYVYKLAPSALADNGWAANSVRAVMQASKTAGQPATSAVIVFSSAGAFPDADKAWAGTLQKEYPGVKIVDRISYDETATTDFAPIVNKLKHASPDIVFFGGNPQGVFLFYPALKASGWSPKATVGMLGGNTNGQFISTVGADIAEGDIAGNYWTPLLKAADGATQTPQGFSDEYAAKYDGQRPDGVGAYYYSAVGVLVDAIKAAGGKYDAESINEGFKKVDIAGMSGDSMGLYILSHGVKFDAKGTNERAVGLVSQIQSGKYVPVFPAESATGDIVYPRQ